jgi:hypothetical protein
MISYDTNFFITRPAFEIIEFSKLFDRREGKEHMQIRQPKSEWQIIINASNFFSKDSSHF